MAAAMRGSRPQKSSSENSTARKRAPAASATASAWRRSSWTPVPENPTVKACTGSSLRSRIRARRTDESDAAREEHTVGHVGALVHGYAVDQGRVQALQRLRPAPPLGSPRRQGGQAQALADAPLLHHQGLAGEGRAGCP